MSLYRRFFVPGGTFFFTIVTERRALVFADDTARRILGDLMRRCFMTYPTEVVAIVILPDHLHALWTLPVGDTRYSLRWGWIKGQFTRQWLAGGGREQSRSPARFREGRRGVWQRRFWEHTIRDEADFEAHFDYIHYNPVKHGLVSRPRDWQWTSFHRWVRDGHYSIDWGAGVTLPNMPGNAGE
jgi:putative transposase